MLVIIFLCNRVRMSWNIGHNKNLFLELKTILGLYDVVLSSPKTSPEKFTLIVVQQQQLTDIEKIYSKKEISGQKWTIKNGRRRKFVSFMTDTHKFNFVVCRYRNNLYLKYYESELETHRLPVTLGKTSLSIELLCSIFQAVHCTGRNEWS